MAITNDSDLVKGFSRFNGFLSSFHKNYASVAFHLTELLRKDSFNWHPQAQEAFDSLKV